MKLKIPHPASKGFVSSSSPLSIINPPLEGHHLPFLMKHLFLHWSLKMMVGCWLLELAMAVLLQAYAGKGASTVSLSTSLFGTRNFGRIGASIETSSLASSSGEFTSSILNMSTAEETPQRNHLWPDGTLSRMHWGFSRGGLMNDKGEEEEMVKVKS
ncbi:hypothetical protein SESBI_09731 [Sesbania bispinosa]|nr:hypothetical protein SESBI_09731 [Sesbania bispinosa]